MLQTPNDVLVQKLGLDIPAAPELVLDGIWARKIHVSWKSNELSNVIHKFVVKVNATHGLFRNPARNEEAEIFGIVGETKRSETSIAIVDLTPHTPYDIQIVAVSAANFRTSSQDLCIRTTELEGDRLDELSSSVPPSIQVLETKGVPSAPSVGGPIASREVNGGQLQHRRLALNGKRFSNGQNLDNSCATDADDKSRDITTTDGETDLARLQDHFQRIQHEIEITHALSRQEDKDFETALQQLETRRDSLKQSLKERDEASTELKRQVHRLESASRAAQNERSKKEKLLEQKEAERRTRREEVEKWETRTAMMADEIKEIETQKIALRSKTADSVAELEANIQEEKIAVKTLEEENKAKVAQIKILEEERKKLVHEETDESRQADHEQQEMARQWQKTVHNLSATYVSLSQAVSQANIEFETVRERLATLQRAYHAKLQTTYSPAAPSDIDVFQQGIQPGRRDPRRFVSNAGSIHTGGVASVDAFTGPLAYPSSEGDGSPTFVSGNTFFNTKNGMTLLGSADDNDQFQANLDVSVGNAPMSPRADLLLPSDLLGDDSADDMAGETGDSGVTLPDIDHARDRFNSVGVKSSTGTVDDHPVSPHSISSHSPSIFLSPQGSVNNVADFNGHPINPLRPKSREDAEPSVSTVTSSRNFVSGIFGLNRQRGKTVNDEPPSLGRLKMGESQSFPRNLGDGLDSSIRRRRLSYGGNWATPMTSLFPRNVLGDDAKNDGGNRLSSSRRAFPNLFSSSKINPINLPGLSKQSASSSGYDQFSPRNESGDLGANGNRAEAGSSRPSSVYSFDRLPRPSSESQPFGWGAPERSNVRGSPLGSDWSALPSRSHGDPRRQSSTRGSIANVAIAETVPEDIYVDVQTPRPLQAPIGTRPSSSQRANTPKLNPTAPSFTTLFARNREKPKDKTKSKEAESSKSQYDFVIQKPDMSPQESRRSKDSRSVLTNTSFSGSRESLDETPINEPSEAPVSKETLIQKITRKSSSTKFNSWKEKGGLFYRKGEAAANDDIDEDLSSDAPLAQSLGSTSIVLSGDKDKDKDKDRDKNKDSEKLRDNPEKPARPRASWKFMRKSKKGEKLDLAPSEASESSERASEVGDEDSHDR